MKRTTTLALVLTLLLGISMTGCRNSGDSRPTASTANSTVDTRQSTADRSAPPSMEPSETTESQLPDTTLSGTLTEIVNRDGQHLGNIRMNGLPTLTNKGIFYTVTDTHDPDTDTLTVGTADGHDTTTYYLYDTDTQQSYSFGSIPEQDYEAGYVRTELNDTLYTLVTTGNALDNTPDPLLLAAFDLTTHTMRSFPISDNGFPYTAMTAVNGQLLILNHDQTDTLSDKLYLFDPSTETTRQVLQFSLQDNSGDTIRQVYCDGESIYLLRLHFQSETDFTLLLDTYDLTFHKQSESDISPLLRESVGESLTPEDAVNEMKQMVSHLLVLNKQFVYYENFSTTRFFGNIDTGVLLEQANGSGDLFLVSSGSGEPFFYVILGGMDNTLGAVVFDWNGQFLEKSLFQADDPRYYLTSASVNLRQDRLYQVAYTNPENRSDTLPPKLYLLTADQPSA